MGLVGLKALVGLMGPVGLADFFGTGGPTGFHRSCGRRGFCGSGRPGLDGSFGTE